MAKKLSAQKRTAYLCPPATCPHPADHVGLAPFIHSYVRRTYIQRMHDARTGRYRAARARPGPRPKH